MIIKTKNNLWQRWDDEVLKFKQTKEFLPSGTKRHWRRTLLFTFMQELSKNLLAEEFETIFDKIIEATQICFGFKRVRFYTIDNKKKIIFLQKTSPEHLPNIEGLKLKIIKKGDDAFKTLFTGRPLLTSDASKLQLDLRYREVLKIEGSCTYAVIPILIEKSPFAMICADTVPSTQIFHQIGLSPEYYEEFYTFAQYITSAIENKKISDQRNLKARQLELIDKLAKIIQAEKEKDKLLRALTEHSVKLVNADGGHLKLYSEKTRKLERVADYGKDIAPPDIKHKPVTIGFSNWVFKTGKILLLGDVTNHPLMLKQKEYCRKFGLNEYLEILENRKSVLIVPLKTQDGNIIGVIDLHSKILNKFNENDKENLLCLVYSVIIAVDKTQQLERQKNLLLMREKLHTMLQRAVEKANNLRAVLEIIRNSCLDLEIIKDLENVCLAITNPQTSELTAPLEKCLISQQSCDLCLEKKPIITSALTTREIKKDKKNLALPILYSNEAIGVLYFKAKKKIILSEDELELLKIISNTASILITMAKDYDKKIKQSTTLYEAGQLSTKKSDFSEWFHPIMKKVMDILGADNRNFHLVSVEKENDEIKLIVKETSDLFVDGIPVSIRDKIFGLEIPLDKSLCGLVVKEKRSITIPDIDHNKISKKLPYYEYEGSMVKSEAAIPLKVKEGIKDEVIGVLVIDSVIPDDLSELDLKFMETIANYLAITLHNLLLYEERAKYQEKLLRSDRRLTLTTLLNFFYHELSKPLQEIKSSLNLINLEKTRGLDIAILGNYSESNVEIKCFPDELELAFRLIISNAIKYSKGLEKLLRYLKINIDKEDGERPLITISFESRTTEQIPLNMIDSIFEPYVRGATKEQGIGLGLALTDLCIKRNMGDIEAENIDNDAVRFTIKIPEI